MGTSEEHRSAVAHLHERHCPLPGLPPSELISAHRGDEVSVFIFFKSATSKGVNAGGDVRVDPGEVLEMRHPAPVWGLCPGSLKGTSLNVPCPQAMSPMRHTGVWLRP